MATFLHIEHASFSFPGMTRQLFDNIDAHFPPGWTGIVGPNGAGKSTLLRMAIGEFEPQSGRIVRLATAVYVPQRTDEPPPGAEDFQYAYDAEAFDLRQRLGIGDDWLDRWNTLSHGERKRFQIASALWRDPELLALDEPTNHIDSEARELLASTLRRFRGVGLLVSHDRAFLDSLCSQCLFIDPPNATMRPGGVTAGSNEDRRERQEARDKDDSLRHSAERLKQASQKRREEADQQAKSHKAAASRRPPMHDHDGRAKRQLAKLTGKDSWAVNQSAALAKRAGKDMKARAGIGVKKEYEMGFWIEDAGCSPRNCLVHFDPCEIPLCAADGEGAVATHSHAADGEGAVATHPPASAGALGSDTAPGVEGRRVLHLPELRVGPTDRIALAGCDGEGAVTARHPDSAGALRCDAAPGVEGRRVLRLPELRVGPTDRIALTGPNGAGKSTLVRRILEIANVPSERIIYVPQEITAEESARILKETSAMPRAELGKVMTSFSRLGSRPARLLESELPSPGEIRKLLLSLGVVRGPHLIVMDEPTNHLDLPSIECLEEALAECPCALILVSHDQRFLDTVTNISWRVQPEPGGDSRLVVE